MPVKFLIANARKRVRLCAAATPLDLPSTGWLGRCAHCGMSGCSLRGAGLTSRDWLAGQVYDNPVAELVGQCVGEAAGHCDRRVAAVTSSADTAGYA
jgi:hypothetical protein